MWATARRRAAPHRVFGLAAALLLCLPASSPASAAELVDNPGHGRSLVVLCSNLTAEALSDPSLPSLQALAKRGAVGLVALPVAASPDEATAVLSLSCGVVSRAETGDGDIYRADEEVENAYAWQVLARRTGRLLEPDRRQSDCVHLGIASLQRRGLARRITGATASALGCPDRFGSDPRSSSGSFGRLAGLFAVDEDGVAPAPSGRQVRVVTIHVGEDRALLERELSAAQARWSRVWVIGARSERERNEYAARPALSVMAGLRVSPGLMTSATTRTRGLVSFSDVKPTLLAWAGAQGRVPPPGHVIEVLPSANPVDEVHALDNRTTSHIRAMVPVLLTLGLLAAAIAALGVASLWRFARLAPAAASLLYALMYLPVGFLVGSILVPQARTASSWEIGGVIVASSSLMALLVGAVLRLSCKGRSATDRCAAALAATCVAILADAAAGQPLMKGSLLAACGISGIRFYGIGNEYMGILIAASLGAAHMLKMGMWQMVLVGIFVCGSLGLGMVGANAGGVVTAVVAFGLAARRAGGLPVRAPAVVVLILCGVAAAWCFAVLDRWMAPVGASHLGAALGIAHSEGVSALGEIMARKALMNLRILSTWPALLAIGAITLLLLAAAKRERGAVSALRDRHPQWTAWQTVTMPACGVAFLFNDTGVVSALFIFGMMASSGLYLCLAARAGAARV